MSLLTDLLAFPLFVILTAALIVGLIIAAILVGEPDGDF